MNIPPIESLLETVQDAESALTRTMLRDGRHVSEYRDALKRFAVAWFVLEKSRQPEEFLPPPGRRRRIAVSGLIRGVLGFINPFKAEAWPRWGILASQAICRRRAGERPGQRRTSQTQG